MRLFICDAWSRIACATEFQADSSLGVICSFVCRSLIRCSTTSGEVWRAAFAIGAEDFVLVVVGAVLAGAALLEGVGVRVCAKDGARAMPVLKTAAAATVPRRRGKREVMGACLFKDEVGESAMTLPGVN